MSNQTELKPCPCGKTPASINVVGEHDKPKYAYCYGDCCNAWEVEFRNDHAELHGNESNAKAVDAWNAAPRAFLAKIDAADGEVPEGFTLVENKALSTARMALAHATTTHGELYRDAYESLLPASSRQESE
jgi:hypothetical protein